MTDDPKRPVPGRRWPTTSQQLVDGALHAAAAALDAAWQPTEGHLGPAIRVRHVASFKPRQRSQVR
jgi:hypothetical protein